MLAQLMLSGFIVDHLTVVHQCFDACNKILGILFWPGYNILKFSEVYMGVDIMCHSLLYLFKESRNIHFGCSSFFFITRRLQGFGSQSCKDVSEVILTVGRNVVEKEPVLLSALKNRERVIGIL